MTSSPHILIVDDQLSAREVLKGLLMGQGYQLAFADSGQQALIKAAQILPDLILLDVMMPDMDGFRVCEQLRSTPNLAEVPIILITALDDHASRIQGLESGADDFISKPFDPSELTARVRTITRLNRYRHLLQERSYRQQAEDEVHRRNRELTLLNEVIVTAASTFNIKDILYIACQALAQIFNVPQAIAILLNETQTEFVTQVEYRTPAWSADKLTDTTGTSSGYNSLLNAEIPLVGLLSEYFSLTNSAIIISPDTLTDPQFTPIYDLMRERGFNFLIIEPIPMNNQLAGIIELKSTDPLIISQHNLVLAQSVATTLGQCLETAYLYQKLQHHAEKLEDIVAQRTRQLQTERDRTQAILQALGEAVIVTDTEGIIQYINPATVALTGFTPEEAVGETWHLWQSSTSRERTDSETQNQLYDEILQSVVAGDTWRGEVNNIHKWEFLYDALQTVAPIPDIDDPSQIIGYVIVQNNITPLKEAERIRAEHQEKENQAALDRLRYTFLSTINHEMRTPLALIFQGIEMLQEDRLGDLTEEQQDAIASIQRQTWMLGQMVEGLTRVAAFLSKQETVRPVWAQLDPVFSNIIALAQFKARSKEITIQTDIPPDLPALPLDVKQIEEALTQLVDNAIKFNHTGGVVKLNAQADEIWLTIMITDTGVGIAEDQRNKIWELFEQGADPLRRAQEGLGLGLVLARYIIEAHRGKIELESEVGVGSTFRVKLPRTKVKNESKRP